MMRSYLKHTIDTVIIPKFSVGDRVRFVERWIGNYGYHTITARKRDLDGNWYYKLGVDIDWMPELVLRS